MGWGWALIWVWLGGGGGGRLFEVGANSRLGAYSNKYGISFLVPECRAESWVPEICYSSAGGRGYTIYPWVGRWGPAPHTLTLFETKIADFPTLFKTEFRFLIPCLRHLTRNHTLCKTIINIKTLSYLIHWQSQNYLQLDQQSHAGCLSSKKRYPV